MTLMATETPAPVETDSSAGCRAFLRQMAAQLRCNCRRAEEPCFGKRAQEGLCRDCAAGCVTLRLRRPDVEDEVINHALDRRLETTVTRESPEEVRAARQATIDRAIVYLTATDRATVLATLAKTRFHDHVKTDPDRLLQDLRDADPDRISFFARWKAAQNVLLAAGLSTT
jgi:hypothetical protein